MIKDKGMKYYYILWGDAINWTRSSVRTIGIWKLHTLSLITLANGFNLITLSLIVEKIIGTKVSLFGPIVEVTQSESINQFIGGLLIFFLPPLLINYFLIFYKNRWKVLRKRYPSNNGKIYKRYIAISVIIPIWTVLTIGFLFYGYNPFR